MPLKTCLCLPSPSPPPPRYDLNIPKVAERLERAVDAALDGGFRTPDIYRAGQPGEKLVMCSEMGEVLLQSVSK